MSSQKTLRDLMLAGEARKEALGKISEQMDAWGLTMPDVEPLPLHFGLGAFHETGETEFWVANETESGYCGKFLFVFDGQTCPYHRHKVKHETFFVVKGEVGMVVDGKAKVLRQGDVLAMEPGTGHSFTGRGPALLLEASMPSIPGDSFFEDKNIGVDGVG